MDQVEVLGSRLEVERVDGESPTLVFLHEGLGSCSAWRGFPAAVARATGRRAFTYSRRGYGRSDPHPGPWRSTFMHEEAHLVLPALLAAEQVHEPVLVGHSDGASIALLFAASPSGRGVRAVCALAPHVLVEDITVRSIAALRATFADPDARLRERLARHHVDVEGVVGAWTDVWLDPAFRGWDIRASLAAIQAPVLVIQGADDEYGTTVQVDAVCGGVAGTAHQLLVPAAGHAPHRDAPDVCIRAIAELVASA